MTNAEFALISLLAEAPLHGYGVEQVIEQRGMRQWTEIGFSSIYFLLKKLENRGLIEPLEKASSSRRTPKSYKLTADGARAYREAVYHALVEPSRSLSNFPIGLANWPALPSEQAFAALDERRRLLDIKFEEIRDRQRSQEPLPDFVDALFDYSLTMIEAERTWLTKTIKSFSENEMKKFDVKKDLKSLYSAPIGEFILLDIPPLTYLMIDGHGNPNTELSYRAAVEALYAASYTLKFMSKNDVGRDYVVPPLEGLWWAKNPEDFISRKKDRWSWTMMIMVPDFVSKTSAEAAISAAREKKKNPALDLLRYSSLKEGRAVQTLHIGSYDTEGPILKRMHQEFIPSKDLALSGIHHEIYLSDPRKVASDKLKTILRQPVVPSK